MINDIKLTPRYFTKILKQNGLHSSLSYLHLSVLAQVIQTQTHLIFNESKSLLLLYLIAAKSTTCSDFFVIAELDALQ